MRFDFFENKRLELIEVIRNARANLIDEINHSKGSPIKERKINQALMMTPSSPHALGKVSPDTPIKIFKTTSNTSANKMAKSQSMTAIPANMNNILTTTDSGTSAAIDMAIAKDREMFRK